MAIEIKKENRGKFTASAKKLVWEFKNMLDIY